MLATNFPSSYPNSYISPEGMDELGHANMLPSGSMDYMEESTEVAETIYSRAGVQELLDTDVFPKV